MIKAIETVYDGYRFRSRLEARWAVFFNALGIKWEYEKEGYDINGERYLPDFYIPDCESFVEIKGEYPTEDEISIARELSRETEKSVYILYGEPRHNRGFVFCGYMNDSSAGYFEGEQGGFVECVSCHDVILFPTIIFDDRYKTPSLNDIKMKCRCSPHVFWSGGEKINSAYEKARQARFEHGEKG